MGGRKTCRERDYYAFLSGLPLAPRLETGPDSQGKFTVQVLTDLRTILWVQGQNSAGVWMNAGEVELPTQGPIKAMTLILSHQPQK